MAPSSKKIKVTSSSTSLPSGASDHANTIARLQAEIDRLRAENQQVHAECAHLRAAHLTLQSVTIPHLETDLQGLRDENDNVRAECAGLRDAQSDLQQTLTSPDSWPSIALQIPNEFQTFNFVDYRPADIVAVLKRKFDMPLEDDDFRALLHTKGFDDIRQAVWVHDAGDWYFPMSYFSTFGDLEMCKWLYQNGAAEDIDRVDDDNMGPIYHAGWNNQLPVCKWLFAMGADIYRQHNGYTLMQRACEYGRLSVCQWLVEVDFGCMTSTNPDAQTCMALACKGGHLSVCKWLYDLGAADDISRPSNMGWTPMALACCEGHLSVCEWLYEMGATEDISKEPDIGGSPLESAFRIGHLPIVKWLILKGALHNPNLALHHANVARDLACTYPLSRSRRDDLLAWAEGIVDASRSFRSSIVMGTFLPEGPAAALATSLPAVSMLNGHTVVLEVVADFLGLVRGRELRNVRLFADFAKREKITEENILGGA